ncbi:MAG: hypothetical protein LQ343_001024 [Gyalolechia ehrenbergii]|nr:MAG: hypothetical protein LQ343_001024 [Gyalolechia ehrenbergii]
MRHPETFASVELYRKVRDVLGSHNFRLPVRRFLLDLFDKGVMRKIVLDEDESENESIRTERAAQALYASPAHLLDNPVPKTVERISIWPHRKAVSQAPLCYRRTPVSVTCLHKLQPSLNPGSILPNPQPVIAPPKAGLLVKLDRSHMEEAERNN